MRKSSIVRNGTHGMRAVPVSGLPYKGPEVRCHGPWARHLKVTASCTEEPGHITNYHGYRQRIDGRKLIPGTTTGSTEWLGGWTGWGFSGVQWISIARGGRGFRCARGKRENGPERIGNSGLLRACQVNDEVKGALCGQTQAQRLRLYVGGMGHRRQELS